jgi:hypothetical protein
MMVPVLVKRGKIIENLTDDRPGSQSNRNALQRLSFQGQGNARRRMDAVALPGLVISRAL